MNKKISLSIIAILMIAGSVVYAKSNTNTNCPNKPGCICANVQIVKLSKNKQIVQMYLVVFATKQFSFFKSPLLS
jgi:hypothetical protein